MNTEIYSPPETPTSPEIEAWNKAHPDAVMIDEILECGDAPVEMLEHLRERKAYMARWLSDEFARDRPLTRCPTSFGIRFFDGPWIGSVFRRAIIPDVMEANIERDGEMVRVTALIWDTYEKLMEAGNEEGCRRMAAALYEHINAEERTRATLVKLANELRPAGT